MSDDLMSAVFAEWLAWSLVPLSVFIFVLSMLMERSGPIRLRHWVEEAGGRLRLLYGAPVQFEMFRYLLSVVARLVPVALFLALDAALARLALRAPTVGALVIVVLLVVATELLSRALVRQDPEEALRLLTWAYRVVLFFFTPLVFVLSRLVPSKVFERRDDEDEDEASDEEIEAFIDVGTREGILEPGEEAWLRGIVDFGDTQARSVMTPRVDMICASADSTLEELAEIFIESSHSRIPLYESSIDEILGIVHIRDLLRELRRDTGRTPEEIAKPPHMVPETKTLDELLRELQTRRQQLAIVVDEYGGTAGLVTVEDLIEEIVGEIVDEDETPEPANEELPDGSWRLDGRTHLGVLEELFGVKVDELPYETVGGLIFGALGYVPKVGQTLEHLGLRFQIERSDHRRIRTVQVIAASKKE